MGIFTRDDHEPTIVWFLDQDGSARIFFFAVGDNGHFYVRSGVSFGTPWQDLGIMPSGSPAAGTPAGVTYIDQSGRQIRVFVRGEDGHLNVAWLEGNRWRLQDQGVTPGGEIVCDPAAITYFFEQRAQLIYAFVAAQNAQMYLNKWDGTQWSWVPLGAPVRGDPPEPIYRSLLDSTLSAVTFFDPFEPQTYVFASFHAGVIWSTQEIVGWPWTNHGTPTPHIEVRSPRGGPEVVGYIDLLDKKPRIFAFVVGEQDANLYVRWMDGDNNWNWADQGQPAQQRITSGVGAVHYVHKKRFGDGDKLVGLTDLIFAFVTQGDGNLAINWWDGREWFMDSTGGGLPANPGVGLRGTPRAAAFYENIWIERVFAAVRGVNGNLYVRWWDQAFRVWEWLELGSP